MNTAMIRINSYPFYCDLERNLDSMGLKLLTASKAYVVPGVPASAYHSPFFKLFSGA